MRWLALTFAAALVANPVPILQPDPTVLATIGTSSAEARRDPLLFVTTLSARILHGDRHDNLPRPLLLPLITHGDVMLTCGPAVTFVRRELSIMGIRARNVAL